MNTRYLTSAPLGIAITLSLLYVMQALIELGPGPNLTPRMPIIGSFVHKKIVEHLDTKETKPEPIDPPLPPPPTKSTTDFSDERTFVHFPVDQGPPIDVFGPTSVFSNTDGPLVSIIKVSPNYPASAISKGLEGWVLVQFDVTPLGNVSNVVVLETSHAMFNKSAKAAALRFRYKPRVVDGVAQTVRGLRNRFVYQIKN